MNIATSKVTELHTEPHTGLLFRLVQPAPSQPKRLVILLHGLGTQETDLSDLARGMAPDTLVILVRGPVTLGPGQYAWFRLTFTGNGPVINAKEAEHSRLALIDFVQQVQRQYALTPANTVIAGFSQGGILSASVALSTPALVAGFGLLSGRILPELEPHLAKPAQLAHLQAFVSHGEQDATLPVAWAQRSDQLLSTLGVKHALHLYPIGHGISPAVHADFLDWLASLA
jgi:phospholipase/carboxylesterase